MNLYLLTDVFKIYSHIHRCQNFRTPNLSKDIEYVLIYKFLALFRSRTVMREKFKKKKNFLIDSDLKHFSPQPLIFIEICSVVKKIRTVREGQRTADP